MELIISGTLKNYRLNLKLKKQLVKGRTVHTIGVATTGRLLDSIIPRSRKDLLYLENVIFR